jgi:hypothetical protein
MECLRYFPSFTLLPLCLISKVNHTLCDVEGYLAVFYSPCDTDGLEQLTLRESVILVLLLGRDESSQCLLLIVVVVPQFEFDALLLLSEKKEKEVKRFKHFFEIIEPDR